MQLQPPVQRLTVESVSASPPGVPKIVVQDIAFELEAGQGLGVIGPSGSGKSSLARLLVGVWQPVRGKVRLDGAALDQWAPDALGRHIGYLPQDVELLAGTVAQNIARFEPRCRQRSRDRRRQGRGVHDLIVRLPAGYDTQDRRAGLGPLGRPGAAHRAGARRLSRPFPGRARRAEFESRFRRRGSVDARDPRCARAQRHRRRRRASPERHCRSRSASDDEPGQRPGHRPERRSLVEGPATAARRCRGRSRLFPTAGVPAHEDAAAFKHQRAPCRMGRAIAARGRVREFARLHPSPPAGRRPDCAVARRRRRRLGGNHRKLPARSSRKAPSSSISNVKKVQHPTGGVVGKLNVQDGDRVKAGDILVQLDDTVTRANLAIVTKGLDELAARKARLEAERDGAETVTFPDAAACSRRASRLSPLPSPTSASCSSCAAPPAWARKHS